MTGTRAVRLNCPCGDLLGWVERSINQNSGLSGWHLRIVMRKSDRIHRGATLVENARWSDRPDAFSPFEIADPRSSGSNEQLLLLWRCPHCTSLLELLGNDLATALDEFDVRGRKPVDLEMVRAE